MTFTKSKWLHSASGGSGALDCYDLFFSRLPHKYRECLHNDINIVLMTDNEICSESVPQIGWNAKRKETRKIQMWVPGLCGTSWQPNAWTSPTAVDRCGFISRSGRRWDCLLFVCKNLLSCVLIPYQAAPFNPQQSHMMTRTCMQ
jgi:hypothetical protein